VDYNCWYLVVDQSLKTGDTITMIKFQETKDGYVFSQNDKVLAVGVYEQGEFHLLHDDKLLNFDNAMTAFSYLRRAYEPDIPVSAKTLELFNTPSRAIDNMSKFKYNEILKDIPKEVFHANLPC
jgi:hypothetical protein